MLNGLNRVPSKERGVESYPPLRLFAYTGSMAYIYLASLS